MPECRLPMDPAWPRELSELNDVPDQLFINGTLGQRARVAIVGTRRASPESIRFAQQLASQLARRGLSIVSGGAAGIDRAAHEGALRAKGHTIAVMAGGLEQLYPREHRQLFEQIARQGALVSEYASGTPALPRRFLARNRLIAALASVVFVIEAPARSGALSTAAHARALGRPVCAVPFSPWQVRGRGCLGLLQTGASPIWSLQDALDAVGVGPKTAPAQLVLDPARQQVLAALGSKPVPPDVVAIRAGLDVRAALRVLGLLEREGEVVREVRGYALASASHCPK